MNRKEYFFVCWCMQLMCQSVNLFTDLHIVSKIYIICLLFRYNIDILLYDRLNYKGVFV